MEPLPPNIATYRKVTPNLRLADLSGGPDHFFRRFVSSFDKKQSPNEQVSAYYNSYCGKSGVERHFLSGFIHRLRCAVHTLLGDKVRFLTFGGFPFAALAGFGCYFGFNDFNRKRSRLIGGRSLAGLSILAAIACLVLGMP